MVRRGGSLLFPTLPFPRAEWTRRGSPHCRWGHKREPHAASQVHSHRPGPSDPDRSTAVVPRGPRRRSKVARAGVCLADERAGAAPPGPPGCGAGGCCGCDTSGEWEGRPMAHRRLGGCGGSTSGQSVLRIRKSTGCGPHTPPPLRLSLDFNRPTLRAGLPAQNSAGRAQAVGCEPCGSLDLAKRFAPSFFFLAQLPHLASAAPPVAPGRSTAPPAAPRYIAVVLVAALIAAGVVHSNPPPNILPCSCRA